MEGAAINARGHQREGDLRRCRVVHRVQAGAEIRHSLGANGDLHRTGGDRGDDDLRLPAGQAVHRQVLAWGGDHLTPQAPLGKVEEAQPVAGRRTPGVDQVKAGPAEIDETPPPLGGIFLKEDRPCLAAWIVTATLGLKQGEEGDFQRCAGGDRFDEVDLGHGQR